MRFTIRKTIMTLSIMTVLPLSVALTLASPARQGRHADHYHIKALPGLGGGENSVAFAISSSGLVVGQANANGYAHAVLWDHDAVTDIGVLPDNMSSFGHGVNRNGDVVGRSEGGNRSEFPGFVWTRQDGATDLPLLTGGRDGYAMAINDQGQSVGWSNSTSTRRAVMWQAGQIRLLNSKPDAAEQSEAYAINSKGHAVGMAWVLEPLKPDPSFIAGNRFVPNYPHAFLWKEGVAIDLGVPVGFKSSIATAISDTGDVAGYAVRSTEDRFTQALLWHEGKWSLLETPPDQNSRANAINSHGVVVGYVGDFREQAASFAWKTRAVLWDRGKVIDLNSLIPADSGWLLTEANGINDAGQIVGAGRYKGARRAFLLTPD
ncbi:MAG TPA: DUF3466 family protein [Chthonomonadaceae bacterium]|nr:DUF3466 family protein [Chthonomonadaceae bacterium]